MISDFISRLILHSKDPFTDNQLRNVRFLLAFYAVKCSDSEKSLTEAVRIVLEAKDFMSKLNGDNEPNV